MGEKGLSKRGRHLLDVDLVDAGFRVASGGSTAFNPDTGQNAAYDYDKGTWVDTKTGEPVIPPLLQ